jgi:hypothetical protein
LLGLGLSDRDVVCVQDVRYGLRRGGLVLVLRLLVRVLIGWHLIAVVASIALSAHAAVPLSIHSVAAAGLRGGLVVPCAATVARTGWALRRVRLTAQSTRRCTSAHRRSCGCSGGGTRAIAATIAAVV